MCIIDKKQSIISRYDDSIIIIRKLILFHVYLLLSYIKKKNKRFLVSLKYVRKARSREKFFSPSFETTLLVHPTCLEKAKEERGVSSPLSLRTMLVHKSRSRGRSVRAILGGLKLLGREQSANRSNTQI